VHTGEQPSSTAVADSKCDTDLTGDHDGAALTGDHDGAAPGNCGPPGPDHQDAGPTILETEPEHPATRPASPGLPAVHFPRDTPDSAAHTLHGV
jgi:hypothetical protein